MRDEGSFPYSFVLTERTKPEGKVCRFTLSWTDRGRARATTLQGNAELHAKLLTEAGNRVEHIRFQVSAA